MITIEVFQYNRYWDYSNYTIPKVKVKHGKNRRVVKTPNK